MARKWIQSAIKRPGALTRKAKRVGKTAAEYAAYVRAHPERFSKETRWQANLEKTLSKLRKRKRKRGRRKLFRKKGT